jgi:glyoxylase-like metal-dependent hydrolase (beta-lactamase superfamily II)
MLKIIELTERIKFVELVEKSHWRCNGLVISQDDGLILIDCNFPGKALDDLLSTFNRPVKEYYVTHMHLDHACNIADVEERGIKVYAPETELKYISDFRNLLLDSGAVDLGTEKEMSYLFDTLFKFRNTRNISGYTPGTEIETGPVAVRPIPLPGHSPGHTGFQLIDGERSLLFTTDMGMEKLGAWYGFRYCSVPQYRKSLNLLIDLYREGDILLGSHCNPCYEYRPDLLHEIIDKINASEERLLNELERGKPVSVEALTRKGIYYRKKTIEKMEGPQRKLYLFWEYCSIENLLEDLEESGKVTKTEDKKWTLNLEYIS